MIIAFTKFLLTNFLLTNFLLIYLEVTRFRFIAGMTAPKKIVTNTSDRSGKSFFSLHRDKMLKDYLAFHQSSNP